MKHIKAEFEKLACGNYTCRIVECTGIERNCGLVYTCGNGVAIRSDHSPEYSDPEGQILNVWGSGFDDDLTPFFLKEGYYKKVKAAIIELNEHFKGENEVQCNRNIEVVG